MLTREQLLDIAQTPLKPAKVVTPFGEVYVPRMTAKELAAFYDAIEKKPKGVELSLIMVDEFGTRLFAEKDAEQLERLPAAFTMPVSRDFREANGLVPKDSAPPADSPTG